ncbi:MAG: response regulator [Pseudomonadota bacterium]|nr:response regulator [Pseudomonadota bacterium]
MVGTARIVVVDDESEIRAIVAEYLAKHGFAVRTADGGPALRALLAESPADIVMLDIAMPGEDGLSLARHLREQGGMGIIMLTAAGESVDRIVGLEVGADDYITKPFDLREVLARVRSLARRLSAPAPAGEAQAKLRPDEVRLGRRVLDLSSRRLRDLDGTEIPLTAMEFDLLQAFATRPNRVLSRDQLLDLAHGRDPEPFDRSIDIRIARIRRKIEDDPAKPSVIKTIRGVGYMFVPSEGEHA